MKCLNCEHIDMRSYPRQAKHGYGRCAVQENRFVAFIYEQKCSGFSQAPADMVSKRIEWWEGK